LLICLFRASEYPELAEGMNEARKKPNRPSASWRTALGMSGEASFSYGFGVADGVALAVGVRVAVGTTVIFGVAVGFFTFGVAVGEIGDVKVAVGGGETKITFTSGSLGKGDVNPPFVVI